MVPAAAAVVAVVEGECCGSKVMAVMEWKVGKG